MYLKNQTTLFKFQITFQKKTHPSLNQCEQQQQQQQQQVDHREKSVFSTSRMSHTLSLTPQTSLHLPTSQIFLYLERSTLERFSISNVPLSQTSLYLERFSISNVFPSQTFLYHEHFYISNYLSLHLSFSNVFSSFHLTIQNISPSRTILHLKHLSISNVSPSQTSLHLKNLSISNTSPS